jgi:hypothetical protein
MKIQPITSKNQRLECYKQKKSQADKLRKKGTFFLGTEEKIRDNNESLDK